MGTALNQWESWHPQGHRVPSKELLKENKTKWKLTWPFVGEQVSPSSYFIYCMGQMLDLRAISFNWKETHRLESSMSPSRISHKKFCSILKVGTYLVMFEGYSGGLCNSEIWLRNTFVKRKAKIKRSFKKDRSNSIITEHQSFGSLTYTLKLGINF